MIQYPKIRHLTLPSVDCGLGSINILKDPPRSIVTTYKPKVGDTSQITEAIDNSGDRVCEAINVYSRGINPMVSCDYGNSGTNGGQVRFRYGANQPGAINSGASYLPYRVNRDSAFRPPIQTQYDLLPLSRLPRLVTRASTNYGSELTNIVNYLTKCKTDMKSIKEKLLQAISVPVATFNIERPQPRSTLGEIRKDLAKACATANVSATVERPQEATTCGNIQAKTNYSVDSNMNQQKYHIGLNTVPERGVNNNKRYSTIDTKVFKNVALNAIDSKGNLSLRVRNGVQTPFTTNVSGSERCGDMSRELALDRNRPMASMQCNPSQRGVDINSNINDRTAKLAPRAPRGGFLNDGFKPSTDRAPKW